MIKPQTLKGFRDFLPETAIKRQFVIGKIKEVFERFGFDPLETPALEYASTLKGKYGAEADKLMYIFTDNGGREVGLRYDQTVPTARVVAQYPDIPKPLKRYQIQPVWRAENTQKGRYREFLQCDADIFGPKSYTADAEIITVFAKCYEALDIDYVININSREILFSMLKGIVKNDEQLWLSILQSIDKLDKKSEEDIREELKGKNLTDEEINNIFLRINNIDLSQDEWLKYVKQICTTNFDINEKRINFSPTLVRGLDYYTGIIFEAVDKNNPSSSSLGGGGRYDKLIGQFSGTDIPAVGFALGFDRIVETIQKFDTKKTNSVVFILTIPEKEDSIGINSTLFNLATRLRKKAIPTELNLDTNASWDKQLKYADRKGIPYVIIQGPDEIKRNVVKLKTMQTKEQEELTVDQVIEKLTNE